MRPCCAGKTTDLCRNVLDVGALLDIRCRLWPSLSAPNLSARAAAPAPPALRLILERPGTNLLLPRCTSLAAAAEDGFIRGCVTGTAFGAGGKVLAPTTEHTL